MKEKAIQIVKTLQDKGFEAVFAGGCVRDMLMGVEPKDYDIATSALPKEIKNLLLGIKRDFLIRCLMTKPIN